MFAKVTRLYAVQKFILCCLILLLKQNSNSFDEPIFFCLYCMKPVLAAIDQ